jgi:hypothetical protein
MTRVLPPADFRGGRMTRPDQQISRRSGDFNGIYVEHSGSIKKKKKKAKSAMARQLEKVLEAEERNREQMTRQFGEDIFSNMVRK